MKNKSLLYKAALNSDLFKEPDDEPNGDDGNGGTGGGGNGGGTDYGDEIDSRTDYATNPTLPADMWAELKAQVLKYQNYLLIALGVLVVLIFLKKRS